jgi:hypothetical protein
MDSSGTAENPENCRQNVNLDAQYWRRQRGRQSVRSASISENFNRFSANGEQVSG